MVIITRNCPETAFKPYSWYTRQEIEPFLTVALQRGKWDTAHVCTLLEAFAIANCDISGTFLLRSRVATF
jgi:hypothetical protein